MAQVDTVLNDFILNVLSDEEFQNLAEKDGNQLYFTDLIEYYTKEEARALMTLFRGQFANWESVPTSIADYASDFAGSKTPTQNNIMVVKDASGYATDVCDILSHVQSTGTQYINLGIIPTVGMKYVVKFQASDSTTGTIFGTDGCDMHVYQGEKNPVTEINIGTTTELNGIGVSSGFDINYELTIKANGVSSKASNVTISNPYKGNLPTTEMYLLAKNTADVATDFSACIVKGFKVYEGENLLMDLVPARRVLDGAIGFVDIMTNVFYENLGADPLIAGDVVSAGETPDDTSGSWLFIYNGKWNEKGKTGWTPACALDGSGSALPDQTDNAGKFLMTNGTTASWSDKPLVNNATENNSIAVGGTATGATSVVVGHGAKAVRDSVAAGANTNANSGGVAIGANAQTPNSTSALPCIAIGYNAKATAASGHAIQLGSGTNNDANTFKVANTNGNFEMMSADGTIPADRIGNLDFGTMD